MPYIAPQFDVLLQTIPHKNEFPDESPSHLLMADQLTEIIRFFIAQKNNFEVSSVSELVGANVFFLETIGPEYYLHSPEFQKGYIYNSGSPLYSFIAKGLNITAENMLTPQDKLIFLTAFDKWITEKATELEPLLQSISIKELQEKTKQISKKLLSILTSEIEKIINAVPTETSIKTHMETLPNQYQQQKTAQSNSWFSYFTSPNKQRMLLAQLAQLISAIQSEDESYLSTDAMTRAQRIKIGLLLYIAAIIEKEYWIRSAFNSTLYCTCKKILNTCSVENLDAQQKVACLSAFRNFISFPAERSKLESAAREEFKKENLLENIDVILDPLSEQVHALENQLKQTSSSWNVTNTLTHLGMMVGAAPGYALGSLFGAAVSETESTHLAKATVGAAVCGIATAVFQSTTAGYFSFVMGDFLVKSTLTRAFAKLFEYVGMTIGGAVGKAAGTMLTYTFELSHAGLVKVAKSVLNYCDDHPTQMRNADRKFIQCLLDLSPDLFSDDKQNRIVYAGGLEKTNEADNEKPVVAKKYGVS